LSYVLPWRSNCALVRCQDYDFKPQSPSELTGFCESHYIPSIGDWSSFDHHAKLLLGSDVLVSVGKVYERNPSTTNWYYELFTSGQDAIESNNVVIQYLVPPKRTPVKGDVLLVKNGPRDGQWKAEFTTSDVIETLWWYYKSGRDATEVFGERELARFISSIR
jgi:hypothetical protein